MNKVTMIGRLTKDLEMKYTANGTAICNFNIAVKKWGKREEGKPDADFFRITTFGKTAENCANFLSKGRQVAINGHIQNDNYEKDDGTKVYRDSIIANEVEFLGSASDEPQRENAPLDVTDDDLPF